MNVSTDMSGLWLVALAVITFGSTFYSVWSLINAARLRGVRLTWSGGRFSGLPFLPTLFLAFLLVAAIALYPFSYSWYMPLTASSLWIGLNWWLGAYLSGRRYVTDHGIVKSANDPRQTVAWYQMVDYLERPADSGRSYTFFYQEHRCESGLQPCLRLVLEVPVEKLPEFEKIVSFKLGKTIDSDVLPLTDVRVFK